MGFTPPDRGIHESDAPPGHCAWVVYIAGQRYVRLEVPDDDTDRSLALTFLWSYVLERERHLRLLE